MPPRSTVLLRFSFLSILLALFAGCDRGDTEIKVYKVAKNEESVSAPTRTAPRTSSPPAADGPSQIIGTAPPEWEAQPPAQMRQASFLVRGDNGAVADISLVILGGGAGGDLDNVNRWRRQLGQEPWTEEVLANSSEKVSSAIGTGILVDLAGLVDGSDAAQDGRIVAAIIPRENETWFFKMRGNAGLAAAQKAGFRRWIESLHIGVTEETQPSDSPGTRMPPVAWNVPEGWKTGTPAPMRFATFTATGPDAKSADISVVTFPGDAGGDLANVNRWLGQLGMDSVDKAGLAKLVTPMQTSEVTLKTVDLENEGNRMLAGWTMHDGRSWFFKMTGPADFVGAQKPKFQSFLQSLHFHD